MFDSIGRFAARFRYPIIGFWALALAASLIFAPKLSDVSVSDQGSYLPADEPSVVAGAMATKLFPETSALGQVVIALESAEIPFDIGTSREYLQEFVKWAQFECAPEVIAKVNSPLEPLLKGRLLGDGGKAALVLLNVIDTPENPKVAAAFKALQARLDAAPEGIKGYVTGTAAILTDYEEAALASTAKASWITIVLVVLFLLLIYRSPVSPLIPLVTIGVTYLVSRGVVAALATAGWTTSSITEAFLIVILFGAGTDYCLFLISRFRETTCDHHARPAGQDELGHKKKGLLAAKDAVAKVGGTIASSAGTVIVGMVGMVFARMRLFSNTGPSLALGVFIVLLAGLTLAPALLAILGKKAFWPVKEIKHKNYRFWPWLSRHISRRPVVFLLIGLCFLAPLVVIGTGIKRDYNMLSDIPAAAPSRAGFDLLSKGFGAGEVQPLDVIVTGFEDARSPAAIAESERIRVLLSAVPNVADVRSLALPDGKDEPELASALKVDGQLALLAGALSLDGSAGSMLEGSSSQGDLGTVFDALAAYFADVGKAYPALAGFSAEAARRLEGIKKSMDSLSEMLVLDSQFRIIADQVAGLGKTLAKEGLGGLVAASGGGNPVDVLEQYLSGIAAAYPKVAALAPFADARKSVASLGTEYSKAAGGGGKMNLAKAKKLFDALKAGLPALEADFRALASAAAREAPGAKYSPPLSLIAGFGADLIPASFKAKLVDFTVFLQAGVEQARRVAGDTPAWFLPEGLAAFDSRLDLLIRSFISGKEAIRLQVVVAGEPFSAAGLDTVKSVREAVATLDRTSYVSGGTAILEDLRIGVDDDQGRIMFIVLAGILLVLVLLLRSLVSPLYLVLTILISYGATLGITRIVFEFILGAYLTWWVPFFMFVLLVALGIDYNIFLMGRVKEEAHRFGTREGVHIALERTGGIIASAGIIMAGTFASLFSSSILGLVEIAFAIAAGVLLDTFVIITTLVPALCVLLGRANWWPSKLWKEEPTGGPAPEVPPKE